MIRSAPTGPQSRIIRERKDRPSTQQRQYHTPDPDASMDVQLLVLFMTVPADPEAHPLKLFEV